MLGVWNDLPDVNDGYLNISNAPVFTATQASPAKMPLGQYGLLVRGYHRPGTLATAMTDYSNNVNKSKVYVTLNNSSKRIKHISEGGGATKLDEGGTETTYLGLYDPTNVTAIKAYLNAGRYNSFVRFKATSASTLTIGLKNTYKVDNDLLFVDGFYLYYYGNPNLSTDIKGTDDGLSEEIEGYYDLSGVKLSSPVRGITIVKYKDGHCVKLYK